jgi:MFS transporter, UMF1 family
MAHPQHAAPRVIEDGEIRPVERAPARERWSWAMYDFANTIFSMNVATMYFATWVVVDLAVSSTSYALANAVASLMVVLAIPVLGAVSDARRRRKPWVVGFTLASCIATALIGVAGQTLLPLVGTNVPGATAPAVGWHAPLSQMLWVWIAFVIANFAYQSAQPFYNAMMPELVPENERGRLSGFGTAMGYVGSIVGVLLVIPFFTGGLPVIGALQQGVMNALRTVVPFTATGGRVSTFVPTALLFLLFSLPLILFCRDHSPKRDRAPINWRAAFRDVGGTIRDARRHPGALRFILTSFLYQDAVGTIVSFMTLYAVRAVGFEEGSETTLFLVLTGPAIFGSYIAGVLVDRIGAKKTLMLTLAIWVVLLGAMIAAPSKNAFWIVGLLIGLNFGGVVTAERPVLLSLVPDVEAGRYFSLMLLSSRAAAILGPLLWALTVDGLEASFGTAVAYRAAVFVVALMFAIALLLLRRVPDVRPGARTA